MNDTEAVELAEYLRGVFPTITGQQQAIWTERFACMDYALASRIRAAIDLHYTESKFVDAPRLEDLIRQTTRPAADTRWTAFKTITARTVVRARPELAEKCESELVIRAHRASLQRILKNSGQTAIDLRSIATHRNRVVREAALDLRQTGMDGAAAELLAVTVAEEADTLLKGFAIVHAPAQRKIA